MNDTIINPRQKRILELLQGGPLSRAHLEEELSVSRITVIRALRDLVSRQLVKVQGQGPATTYALPNMNPALRYLDMEAYFAADEADRQARTTFNEAAIPQLTALFSDAEQAKWEQSAQKLAKAQRELEKTLYQRELKRFVIELAWKSSKIEGNTYDLLEAESLLVDAVEAVGHPHSEAVMIINHKKAFDLIVEHSDQFKQLTFPLITQLHNVLIADLSVTTGVRNQPVRITGTQYVPPRGQEQLASHLRQIIDHSNALTYPPDKALAAACLIPYLQPFADGNKRTGRLLANAILLAHGYFPLSYRNVDVTEYRKAMLVFYEQQNLWHFKRLFVEQLTFAMHNYWQT